MSILERFDRWLEHNIPDIHSALGPGYSQRELDVVEESCGLQLPAGFCQFLAWRQPTTMFESELVWPYGGGWAPSFERFLGHQNYMREMAESDDLPPGFASSGWSVFSACFQHNVDALCLDLKGSFGGQPGQLIAYRGWDGVRHGVARNFDVFLEALVSSMEGGLWEVSTYGAEVE